RPAVCAEPLGADALRILDEEIAALPDHLHAAVVLCELGGASRKDAADRLGVPEGTVCSRLAKARKVLAARLKKRGVALSAATLAVIGKASAVPPRLTDRATAIATASAPVPPAVAALSNGVFRAMFLARLKPAATALGLTAAALFAWALLAPAAPAPDPGVHTPGSPGLAVIDAPKPAPQPTPAKPAPAGPGRLLVWTEREFVFYTPDGKADGALPGHPDKRIMTHPVLSPDGKWVAFLAQDDPPVDDAGFLSQHVFVRAADGKGEGTRIAVKAATVFWAADGKRLVVGEILGAKEPKDVGFAAWSIDPDTGEKTALDLPRSALVLDAMPEGKAFVGVAFDVEQKKIHLVRVAADGNGVTNLTELQTEGPNPRVSPDGGKILFQDVDPDEKPAKDDHRLMRLFVFDLKTMKRQRLAEVPLNALVLGYCWSPDGKKVAYTWKQTKPGVPLVENTDNMNDPKINTETESFLVVADADGKNPKTLLSKKAPTAPTITLGNVDWR
ncbi:MAG TPA: sigma factor-like helix-turn-helix DNA-binding protein, partial [Gemmataceae bacterium]|nr:sigma factor-like helix-turn-helix DNA-binding protein [Gemmataceae bacterium]